MENNELYLKYIEEMYEELTELGNSETGRTFLAKHRGNGKIVVKKHIPVKTGKIYEKVKEIHHPNLAKIYDICYGRECCIVIEEYISGDTLEEKLEELKVFPKEVIENYLVQILQGLKEVHRQGVIHRDLTPANILISTDNVVKLIDFGIARNPKENQKKDTLILGTVGYASPEQFGFLQTDKRTDIYAVGILLNKMLTGKLPNEQLTENERFRRIVEKCTQIDPENRYKDVNEILDELFCEKGNEGKKSSIKEEQYRKEPWKEDQSIFPGFRSGVKWRRIVGVIGYVLLGLCTVVPLVEYGKNLEALGLEVIAVLIYVWMTFFIASNFGRWDRRWNPFAKMPKEVTVTIRVIASIVSFYLGVLLENYVRYTILGLPYTQ